MQIILLTDIPKLGQKGDVKEVPDGYARNALIPRKKAEQATPEKLRIVQQKRAARAEQRKEAASKQNAALENIRGETVSMRQKLSERGHLFARIDAKKLASVLKEKGYSGIDAKNIVLNAPIKEGGEHTIKITANGKSAEFVLHIAGNL